jgi:hypothetical protein
MKIDVYCDESCPEVLLDKSAHKYLVIGSLWIPFQFRAEFKESISELRQQHKYFSEIKWTKVSTGTIPFYKSLIDYFFDSEHTRFRAIIVESKDVNLIKFHAGDAELSFYKFYYQLLNKWIIEFNEYNIFLDYKRNKRLSRLTELKRILDNSNLFSSILNVQALPSHESAGIQMCDLLTGIVNGKFNEEISGATKKELINYVELKLGRKILRTCKSEDKFNVFGIWLRGGF